MIFIGWRGVPSIDESVKVCLVASALKASRDLVLVVSSAQQAKSVEARSSASVITNSLIPRAFPAGLTADGFRFHFLIDLAPN